MKSGKGNRRIDDLDLLFDEEYSEQDLIDLDYQKNSEHLEDMQNGRVKNFQEITECPHCGSPTPIRMNSRGIQSFNCKTCGLKI